MTTTQLNAVRQVAGIILEAAVESGERGLIAGHLYAVLMGKLSLDQFQSIMSGLVRAGMLTHENHVYTATDKAKNFKP